jgi:N-acetyl-gamma-glutamyl-phosphate reductase
MKNKKIKAAIVGGSGFTGLELIKILSFHKYAEIKFVTSRTYKNLKVSEVFPSYSDYGDGRLVFVEDIKKEELAMIDVLFLCLPPLESMKYLKENILKNYGGKIIDIGSDFRINDPENYKIWYKTKHLLTEVLSEFVYGLTEIYRDKIKKSRYIANPGCYPTSVLLGVAPILKNKSVKVSGIVIDSKSGITGAGRKLKQEYLFYSLNDNFYAYSPVMHRHIGEMEQEIEKIYGEKINVCFTPHLLPVDRGIFTSIYCKLKLQAEDHNLTESFHKIYKQMYKDSCFVRFLGEKIPQLKDVVGTNMCHIGFSWDSRTHTLKIFTAIDNLLKGAAGQAVQNMNIMMGFSEMEGLAKNGIFS